MGPPGSASASRAFTIKTTIDGIVTERVVTPGASEYNNIVVGPIGAQGLASSSFYRLQLRPLQRLPSRRTLTDLRPPV